MVWREQWNHIDDCYFWITKTEGFSKKTKHLVQYPDFPSVMRPVPHDPQVPISASLLNYESLSEDEKGEDETMDLHEWVPSTSSPAPELFNQEELNDLTRDLGLSKKLLKFLVHVYRNIIYWLLAQSLHGTEVGIRSFVNISPWMDH